jgi:hypothetical protein
MVFIYFQDNNGWPRHIGGSFVVTVEQNGWCGLSVGNTINQHGPHYMNSSKQLSSELVAFEYVKMSMGSAQENWKPKAGRCPKIQLGDTKIELPLHFLPSCWWCSLANYCYYWWNRCTLMPTWFFNFLANGHPLEINMESLQFICPPSSRNHPYIEEDNEHTWYCESAMWHWHSFSVLLHSFYSENMMLTEERAMHAPRSMRLVPSHESNRVARGPARVQLVFFWTARRRQCSAIQLTVKQN